MINYHYQVVFLHYHKPIELTPLLPIPDSGILKSNCKIPYNLNPQNYIFTQVFEFTKLHLGHPATKCIILVIETELV